MKKRKNKVIVFLLCIILLLIFTTNTPIICDLHALSSTYKECEQCLVIYIIQNLLKSIYIVKTIVIFFIYINLINTIMKFFRVNVFTNPIILKVRLNE